MASSLRLLTTGSLATISALGLLNACGSDSTSSRPTGGAAASAGGNGNGTGGGDTNGGTVSGGNGNGAAASGGSTSSGGLASNGGSTSGGGTTSGGGSGGSPVSPGDGAPCGYKNLGKIQKVADGIDVCLPPTICNLETCPAQLGECVDASGAPTGKGGTCKFKAGYDGLKTLPEAWATWYCQLTPTGGCLGTLESVTTDVRKAMQSQLKLPFCFEDKSGHCLGIVAMSPMLGGNSRLAKGEDGKPLAGWGLGLTPASGLCYEVTGPTGKKATLAITDRCAGYCDCGAGMEECGNCLLSKGDATSSAQAGCPCVGNVSAMGSSGNQCAGQQTCDWCMTNSHPHFDVDIDSFNHLCDADAVKGSCKLGTVKPVPCMEPVTWPCPTGSGFMFSDSSSWLPGTYCQKW